jgi:hypothetical protein
MKMSQNEEVPNIENTVNMEQQRNESLFDFSKLFKHSSNDSQIPSSNANNNSNNNIINFKNISVPLSMFIEFKEKVESEMLDLKDKISILSDKNEELNRSIRNKVSVLTTEQSSIRNKINDMEKKSSIVIAKQTSKTTKKKEATKTNLTSDLDELDIVGEHFLDLYGDEFDRADDNDNEESPNNIKPVKKKTKKVGK